MLNSYISAHIFCDFEQFKIDAAAPEFDLLNSHPHAHADAKAATATLTEEAEGGWIEVVKIVGQAAQGHQTLDKHLIQFNKKTKFCYRRNHALRFTPILPAII